MEKEEKQEQGALAGAPSASPAEDPTLGAEAAPTAEPAAAPSRLRAIMLEKFPDKQYADDSEFENGVADYLDQSDKELTGYRESDVKIREVAEDHPELMDIISDLAADPQMPLAEAIARNVDVDEFYPEEGDPDYEAMRKARAARLSLREQQQAFEAELRKNLDESRDIVLNYYKEKNIPEEEAKRLEGFVDELVGGYLQGKITAKALDAFRAAMNYDKDVAEAMEVGKTEGMNAKIDAERQRKQTATDGLPAPGVSAGTVAPPKPAEPKSVFDEVLESSGKRRSWAD